MIELPAAARAAGGQALTEPKLEHFCSAFWPHEKSRKASCCCSRSTCSPEQVRSPLEPAACCRIRATAAHPRVTTRCARPATASSPHALAPHLRIPSFARPQLSSWTRRLALSAPCRRRRRRRLSRRRCHRAPLLPRAAPPRACERRAISGCGGPFGCVSRVSRPRARGVPHRNNTRVTTPIHSESLTSSNLRRASTVPRRSLRSRLRLAIGLCSQPAARQRRRRLLGRQVGDE